MTIALASYLTIKALKRSRLGLFIQNNGRGALCIGGGWKEDPLGKGHFILGQGPRLVCKDVSDLVYG